jgi:ribonuclease J
MWSGYLSQPSGLRLRAWLNEHDIPLHLIHSSGHATVQDLQRLATAVSARQVVPIHTQTPERFRDVFANVVQRQDGEWWDA